MKNKSRWLFQSVSGLLLTGSGLSITIDAGFSRFAGDDWFWYGTFGLIVFQTGICLAIDSLRYRSK